MLKAAGLAAFWPCSTEAATRPNKEHRDAHESPFSHLALAIRNENPRNRGCNTLKGREKVPVPADRGTLLLDGSHQC
jgi:hypothetical protein